MNKCALLLALAVSSAHAQVAVEIMGAVYSVDLSIRTWAPDQVTSSTFSSTTDPVSGSFAFGDGVASGTASPFAVESQAMGVLTSATATVTSLMTFSPTADAATTLGLDFFRGGDFNSSFLSVSLFDLTSAASVFEYSWAFPKRDALQNIPWVDYSSAFIDFGATLFDSHNYQLDLSARTNGNLKDAPQLGFTMSGLTIVSPAPEPETWAMLLLGLGIVWRVTSRRLSTSRSS